jgi:uncharacterized protein YndB with AHSA1/START domain
MNADAVVVEARYPQPIEEVWEALATRAALAAWLMPNDFEPRVGHEFTFKSDSDQWRALIHCEVVAIEAPKQIAYTWSSGGLNTLVTFTLSTIPEGTLLRLVHSGFSTGGDFGTSARDRLGSGWTSKFLSGTFANYLAQRAASSRDVL